jgi:septum formation protein
MYSRTVILASQSPRRKQLLEQVGIPFEVKVVETAETWPESMAVPDIPVHIARQKAVAVQQLCVPENIIIAADTVVVLDDDIIGKPKDREDAIRILSRLSGRTHQVITGVVIRQNGKEKAFSKTTAVHFKLLTQEQITYYVDQYKPFDKAGAYAIQEWIGAVGIDAINGCFYNVMGLPVSMVVEALSAFGA